MTNNHLLSESCESENYKLFLQRERAGSEYRSDRDHLNVMPSANTMPATKKSKPPQPRILKETQDGNRLMHLPPFIGLYEEANLLDQAPIREE